MAQTGSYPTGQRIRPTYRTLMARVDRDDSLLTLTGHRNSVLAVAFGADAEGRPLLASGGEDGTVRLWDPTTGTPAGTLLRRTESVAVATHTTHLAIADAEGITVIEVMDSAG